MPHVASEAPTHTRKSPLPGPARVVQRSEQTPSVFASLLDDGAQPSQNPPSQPPASDQSKTTSDAAATKSAAVTKPAAASKPADDKAAPASGDANATVAEATTTPATAAKAAAAIDCGKPAPVIKSDATSDSSGDGSSKTADTQPTADATTTPPTPPVLPPTTPVAAVAAPVTAIATATPTAAEATAQASDSSQPVDPNQAAQTALAQASAGKPQPSGDADKAAAKALDAIPATGHRVEAASTLPAADSQAVAPSPASDAAQQPSFAAPSLDTASPAAASSAPAASPAPTAAAVPLAGLPVEITSKALAGNSRFDIRLDPPELGRIEVRLSVDRDGKTTTQLIADRADTLDLLRRDASGLERALQDAGLQTSDNGLQFSLRDQNAGGNQGYSPSPAAAQIVVQDDAMPATDITPSNYTVRAGLGGGIDIRV